MQRKQDSPYTAKTGFNIRLKSIISFMVSVKDLHMRARDHKHPVLLSEIASSGIDVILATYDVISWLLALNSLRFATLPL